MVETVNIRLRASGINEHRLDFASLGSGATEGGPTGYRRVYFDRVLEWVDTPIFARSGFVGSAAGPIILESPDTTIVIPPGASVSADRHGNLVAELD